MYTDTFEKIFTLEPEDTMPSSFWSDIMVMFSDENLPEDLEEYSKWEPFRERTRDGWLWHAPYRIFRFPQDDYFLLAQKSRKWIIYDPSSKKLHLLVNGKRTQSFTFLSDVLN